MRTQDQLVTEQFSSVAEAYLTSTVHAQGRDLQELAMLVQAHANPLVLDLGCGAGHASFAVAPHARQVIAYDLSEQTLAVVTSAAQERGLHNIETRQGSTEFLPFDDARRRLRFRPDHGHDDPDRLVEFPRRPETGEHRLFPCVALRLRSLRRRRAFTLPRLSGAPLATYSSRSASYRYD